MGTETERNQGKGWDIVGDIHGQLGKLEALLAKLGYSEESGVYRHPERRMLFLGDYIDRGPAIEGVLRVVRAMVEAGEAVALMGNHELNALHFHTSDPSGTPLRPHKEAKVKQHKATLEQFKGRKNELQRWLEWLARLPLSHETEDFRAVHACWSSSHFADIRGGDLRDNDFLFATSDKQSVAGSAVEILLKGPEIKLPEGKTFQDKDGTVRDTMRVRWWGLEAGDRSYRSLVMPPGAEAPLGAAGDDELCDTPDYPADDKPVFCGHYWMQYRGTVEPLCGNIVCLDYSAGRQGPLVGCRWNGSIGKSLFVTGNDRD